MKDSAFAEPLVIYQERYSDYFRVHCDVELAETEQERAALRALTQLAARPVDDALLESALQELVPPFPLKIQIQTHTRCNAA